MWKNKSLIERKKSSYKNDDEMNAIQLDNVNNRKLRKVLESITE